MKFFKSKDSKAERERPLTARNVDKIKQITQCFGIGSRARYFVDHNEVARMETLIIGYGLDDVVVFDAQDFSFSDDELWLNSEFGEQAVDNLNNFSLLVPSDIGEERKLDYQTRAALGRRGPFAVGKTITLMSLNPSRENLKIHTSVRRNMAIKDGIHAGHTMAVLDVDFLSVEPFESRAQTRVEVNVAATVELSGKDNTYAARVLDISERALRFVLDPVDTPGANFKLRTPVIVKLALVAERPPLVLKGEIMQQRQREQVVEIHKIQRRSEFVDFEILDAMELKIHLQELTRLQQKPLS